MAGQQEFASNADFDDAIYGQMAAIQREVFDERNEPVAVPF